MIRYVLALLPPIVVVASLMGLVLRTQKPSELQFESAPCQSTPVFTPEYGAVKPVLTGFRFDGLGYIQATPCNPGTLTIEADGETFNEVGAQLDVMLDGQIIASPRFTAARTVNLRIPRAGRVQVAFMNDEYEADVRVVFIRSFRTTSASCTRLRTVNIPPENIGQWFPESETGTLVRADPATVTPCKPTRLSVTVMGQPGGGAYPILAIEQSGKRLVTYRTTDEPHQVKVQVTDAPVQLRVLNPYGVTTKDRNANLRSITYRSN